MHDHERIAADWGLDIVTFDQDAPDAELQARGLASRIMAASALKTENKMLNFLRRSYLNKQITEYQQRWTFPQVVKTVLAELQKSRGK